MGWCRLPRGRTAAASIRIPSAWCGVYGFKASFGRIPYVSRPNAFSGDVPYLFEGTITRTVEDAAIGISALTGYHPGDPLSPEPVSISPPALGRSIQGMRIAYSPNLDVFPVDPEVARVVAGAVRVFEQAGAEVEEVKVGITRSQRELSDLWCRLIIGGNLTTLEYFKRLGIDLQRDHRDDLPPEYWHWVDIGYQMSLLDYLKDQEMRTEIYDAIQGVLDAHDLLVTPTLACTAVANATDGNTRGPTQIQGEDVDPLMAGA